MRRPNKKMSPHVDAMEPRAMPSVASPLLTSHALHGIVHDVRAIVRTLSMTDAVGRASVQLTRLAARIPGGSDQLAPAWRKDVGLFNPHTAGSSISVRQQLLDDLYRFVQGGAGGTGGSGSGSTSPVAPAPPPGGGTGVPAPAPSLDRVRINNATGLDLVVTIRLILPQVQQPSITKTIPAQADQDVPFDFGTATNAFMTLNVSRADGGQSPPPFTTFSLAQPSSGYNGARFTISRFGGYFAVTPG